MISYDPRSTAKCPMRMAKNKHRNLHNFLQFHFHKFLCPEFNLLLYIDLNQKLWKFNSVKIGDNSKIDSGRGSNERLSVVSVFLLKS